MTGYNNTITSRFMRDDNDVRAVRRLLIDTYPVTGPGFNWEIRRWDGWRYYDADPSWKPQWEQTIRLWENSSGQIVGAAHPEGSGGEIALQIHPDYRSDIEADMIAWAEDHLAAPIQTEPIRDDQGHETPQWQVHFFVYDYDAPRLRLLADRGYEKTGWTWVLRRMWFGDRPLPTRPLADGYTLRNTRPGDEDDCQRIADILNAAFNRTFHNAGEYRSFTRLAPGFRHDLELVAEAPDGSFAALVGLVYDEDNRRALFEPVCTHPDHRRKRLGQSLMFEGLRRVQALGAAEITVETGDAVPANALYDSIGFTEVYRGQHWRKMW
ncbi:MAG: GNAT family N-acetyltransferase [Anaerolineae bacterium]|nr:GNAT family N-acetyltransferase [Anaerolineae bacterium]